MNKDNKRHGKEYGRKIRRPEKRAKGNSGLPSRRDGLSLGKRYQFIIQCQMFALKTHINGRLWRPRRLYKHVTIKGKVAIDLKENKKGYGRIWRKEGKRENDVNTL